MTMRNLAGNLDSSFISVAHDISHISLEFGVPDTHSLYLTRERHSYRWQDALDKEHSLNSALSMENGGWVSQEVRMGYKWMGREHTLLPADTLRLSARTPCGWTRKLNTQPSPGAELLYTSGQKQNWGRERTSVQAGLSKGLVPTLIVSVGTNEACSVETEPVHKLCFLLPTFSIAFLILCWTIPRNSTLLPKFWWKFIRPWQCVLKPDHKLIVKFLEMFELVVKPSHY